mgnify:CR=1 FL=1
MPNRLLLKAAHSKRLETLTTQNRLTRSVVNRYVAGYTVDDAWRIAAELKSHGIDVSLDFLGESVQDLTQVPDAIREYRKAMERLAEVSPGATISVKLSQLGVLIDPQQCARHLEDLLHTAAEYNVGVELDMEHSSAGRPTLEIFRAFLPRFPRLRQAFQAYLRATSADLTAFDDVRPRIRLVKGAFAEPVTLAIQDATEVTNQYKYLSAWALEQLPDPAFGTHDESCISYVIFMAQQLGIAPSDFEFQMLYGVRRDRQRELAQAGYRVRVYLPYGTEWYPYLMRRMAERPANLLLFLRSVVGN